MKNLESLQLTELNPKEVREVQGGAFGVCESIVIGIAVGVVVSAATVVMTDWDNFKKGFASAF